MSLREFRQALAEKTWFLPPCKTDYFQPVDAGAGRHLKKLMADALDALLENDTALLDRSRWCSGALAASEVRVLLTRLVGGAFESMCAAKANPFRRYFEKTGCLLAADGSGDNLVAPEALDGLYSWPEVRVRAT